MSTHSRTAIHPLVRKLESICDLPNDARAAVASLPARIMELKADQDIVREGDRTSRSCGLIEGFACSFKMTRGQTADYRLSCGWRHPRSSELSS